MSAYSGVVTPIKSISPYFKKQESDFSMVFIGESLELRIPLKFKTKGAITVSDGSVTTPGIMDMIINDTYQAGLNLLATITIGTSNISQMNYKGIDYLVLKLQKGDKFMTSYRVIQDTSIVYLLWVEMITAGRVPYWFDYASMLKLFEHAKELTGQGIGVTRSVFESIIAHIARSPHRVSTPYRLTDMKTPMKLIALDSIGTSTTSTVASLNGSYFRDAGMTSALRFEVDEEQPFENILRGLIPVAGDRAS